MAPTQDGLPARYRVLEALGRGGFGEVLLAEDRERGQRVAIKRPVAALDDPASRQRFEREARIAGKLRHPHVVAALDAGLGPDGRPYTVYEYVDGVDLEVRRSRPPPLATAELLTLARQIASALGAAHGAGIVHRDVKPGNVLLRRDGVALLCDFGIARPGSLDTLVTQEGLILGTPAFMAPELWSGEPATAASDQFAWAASLHLVRHGRAVYAGESPGAINDELRRGWRPPPGADPLDQALARALDPDPARRFPSMDAFAGALQAGPEVPGRAERAAPTVVLGRAPPRPEPAPPARRGARGAALAAALLAGALGAAAALRPGPAPAGAPTPAPAPAEPPADGAGDELEAAMRVAAGSHVRPDRGIDLYRPGEEVVAHVLRVEPELLDPRFAPRWRRFLAVLRAWVEGFKDHPDGLREPRNQALAVRVGMEFVLHVINDFRTMSDKILRDPKSMMAARGADPESLADHLKLVTSRVLEIGELLVAHADALAKIDWDRSGLVLGMEAHARRLSRDSQARSACLDRLHSWNMKDPAGAPVWLVESEDLLTPEWGEFSVGSARSQLDREVEFVRLADGVRGRVLAARALDLAVHSLNRTLLLLVELPPARLPGDQAAVERLFELVGRDLEVEPVQAYWGLGQLVVQLQRHMNSGQAARPDLKANLDRVVALYYQVGAIVPPGYRVPKPSIPASSASVPPLFTSTAATSGSTLR